MTSLRDQNTERTRRAILDAARTRFGRDGFAATSLDEIAGDAAVTKGAIYHHFPTKVAVFTSVYDEVEAELTAASVDAAIAATDGLDALQRGFAAFLDRALDPGVQQIAIVDAPAVLGPATKQEIDEGHSLTVTAAGVRIAIDDGLLDPDLDAAATAQLLLAACNRAALTIAAAASPQAARSRAGRALERLVAGLAHRP